MKLRRADAADLDFILAQESRQEFADYIYSWPRAQHLAALEDPDYRYLVAEQKDGVQGFAMLCGLTSAERTIELKRIAVATPGRGLGRSILRGVIRQVFEELRAERLWLDVFADNPRARAAYRAVGFVEDGVEHVSELRDVPLIVMSISRHEGTTATR
ncbi:MAG: GNAT family N-acetyltransferase [Kiloniellales bacterium]|nr:GNAT family N-acetyltransferase [Kiloniellales bacterium]